MILPSRLRLEVLKIWLSRCGCHLETFLRPRKLITEPWVDTRSPKEPAGALRDGVSSDLEHVLEDALHRSPPRHDRRRLAPSHGRCVLSRRKNGKRTPEWGRCRRRRPRQFECSVAEQPASLVRNHLLRSAVRLLIHVRARLRLPGGHRYRTDRAELCLEAFEVFAARKAHRPEEAGAILGSPRLERFAGLLAGN